MKIKDIGKVITGKTPSTKNKENFEGIIKFITPEDIAKGYIVKTTNRHISEKGYDSIKANTLDGISVLVGCIGSDMGNVAISEGRCACNQQINAITNIADSWNPFYIYYYLSKKKRYFQQIAGITTTPILSKSIFEEINIPYIEKELQDKIANNLKLLDDKIDNNNEIIVELEAMVKTIYDYWFLQFDFPDENEKPYRSSGGKMVWNEKLKREIPERWEVRKIEDILAPIPTTKKYKLDEYGKGNKYPIIDQSSKYICGYTDDESQLLKLEDCIVFGDHTKNVKYVNFAFARGADGTQVINSSISNLPNYILYRQILDMDIVSQGYSRYFKFLKDKYVIVPQKNVSDGFINCINDSLSKMKHIINENRELKSLRDFLLPLLLNGQIGFKK